MAQLISSQLPRPACLAQRATRLTGRLHGRTLITRRLQLRTAAVPRAAASALPQHQQHSGAASGQQQAALFPAGSPVLQLAVVAPQSAALQRPPPQALIVGGTQIPNSLVWALLGAVSAFWALFIGVLVVLFPTLREVFRSAREVRRCAGSVISCCAEVEDLAKDVRLNFEVASQGLDRLKTIPANVGQQLYSIVNWDADDDEEPDNLGRNGRGGGGRGWGSGRGRGANTSGQKKGAPMIGLRERVVLTATQVSKVAARVADIVGGKKKGAEEQPKRITGEGSSAAEAASGGD